MSTRGRSAAAKRKSSAGTSTQPAKISRKKSSITNLELKPDFLNKDLGVILVCGTGDYGQLGLGEDVVEKARPALISTLTNVVDIAAGAMHSLALTADGKVYSWGCNDDGTLGRTVSDEGTDPLPGEVSIPEKVVQISAGEAHSAALSESGNVYAWGSFRDQHGIMGLTPDGLVRNPVLIMEGCAKITSGAGHLLALNQRGVVFTLGRAEQGQLGRISQRFSDSKSRHGVSSFLKPNAVHVRKKVFDDIWAGSYNSFAREHITGMIYAFGLNNYHQLGLVDTTLYFHPTLVASFNGTRKWSQIVGGEHHTLALEDQGTLYVLGRKDSGRLGLGNDVATDAMEPVPIPAFANKNVVSITCGDCVSFAVTDQGEAYGWGMNTAGQLGIGSIDDYEDIFEPALIKGKQLESRKVMKISSGGHHTLFLVKDKTEASN